MHTYRPGNLRDEIPRRRRLWPIPGCNAMEEEEEEEEDEEDEEEELIGQIQTTYTTKDYIWCTVLRHLCKDRLFSTVYFAVVSILY
jgi:hypothetical protein